MVFLTKIQTWIVIDAATLRTRTVPNYFRYFVGEPHDKICRQSDIECYDKAEDDLYKKELDESLKSNSAENKRGVTNCHCLPSCTSITYDAEISQADYDWRSVLKAHNASMDELTGLH
jgi:hypothetical protein